MTIPDPILPPAPTIVEQHIYHHSDSDGIRINVKVEKNSRGFNYEVSVTGAQTVTEAIFKMEQTKKELEASLYRVQEPELPPEV